jgi:aryl-alcohol dehydrogenase-like predicted oxidoreductase
MHTRSFDGIQVGEVGLGCWQIGGSWAHVEEEDALAILRSAYAAGVTFFDTADVYGAGRSERLIARWVAEDAPEGIFVATKQGRFSPPGWPENWTLDAMRQHINASRERLNVDCLDLVQLHCIPTDALREGTVFDHLRTLQGEGLIKRFGASVESMEEAEICMAQLFDKAQANGTSLIVRLPLASGLLSGKMTKQTAFGEEDHRNFNRDGAAFNVGETFSGLPYDAAIDLVDALRSHVPQEMTMAQFAMRWILDHPAVTVVIPGASRPDQVASNVSASSLAALPAELHAALEAWYRSDVDHLVRGPY